MNLTTKNRRWWLWDYLFDNYQWYRRSCGGHWEQWHNGICHCEMWLQVDACSKETKARPGGCFGTPTCEDYGGPRASKPE